MCPPSSFAAVFDTCNPSTMPLQLFMASRVLRAIVIGESKMQKSGTNQMHATTFYGIQLLSTGQQLLLRSFVCKMS